MRGGDDWKNILSEKYSDVGNLAIFFLSLSQIFYFIFNIQIHYGLRSVFKPKYSKKMESCEPLIGHDSQNYMV